MLSALILSISKDLKKLYIIHKERLPSLWYVSAYEMANWSIKNQKALKRTLARTESNRKKTFTARVWDPTIYPHSYLKIGISWIKTLTKIKFMSLEIQVWFPIKGLVMSSDSSHLWSPLRLFGIMSHTKDAFNIVISIPTCIRHFTKSRGTTAVCVRPQLKTPPKPHSA